MHYREYLKKVAEAKKHLAEYVNFRVRFYRWGMITGFIGAAFFASIPTIYYLFIFFCVTSGILSLVQNSRALADFKKEFKCEADCIAEHDELLK